MSSENITLRLINGLGMELNDVKPNRYMGTRLYD